MQTIDNTETLSTNINKNNIPISAKCLQRMLIFLALVTRYWAEFLSDELNRWTFSKYYINVQNISLYTC